MFRKRGTDPLASRGASPARRLMRDRPDLALLVRCEEVFRPFGTLRLGHGRSVENAGAGPVLDPFLEDRGELHVAVGLLAQNLAHAGDVVELRAAQEGEDPVIMGLLVVVDEGVVVALGALEVTPEEDAADVAGRLVRLGVAVDQEPRRGAAGRVEAVGREDLGDELLVGDVLRERPPQEGMPLGRRDRRLGAALHQHHIEDVGHPPRVGRAFQQPVDQTRPLVRRGVVEELARLVRGRNHPGEVQTDPSQELGVRGRRCGLAREPGFDQAVNRPVKRLTRGHLSDGLHTRTEQQQKRLRLGGRHGAVLSRPDAGGSPVPASLRLSPLNRC
ncbi:MAG: hypothetical protein U0835_15885 [Isosphaeraceae bacterium]